MNDNERNINNDFDREINSFQEETPSRDYSDINFIMKPEIKKTKKRKRKSLIGYIAVALVAAIIGGISGSYIAISKIDEITRNQDRPLVTAQDVNINLSDDIYFAAAVAEKSQKTVVGITTDVVQRYNTFWGPQMRPARSMGSGFIVDSSGYIVTNSHVVGDGQYDSITVSLIDGSTEVGEVLWYDSTLDLAVVKINRTGLPVAELGDSDKLMVGEPAVAIGNPMTLDLERTVTQGIISGLNRTIQFDNGTVIEPLIQTDASINSGNSGGPLFNAKGQVIGINTAKINSAEGLGFSIPINTAKPIIEQVIRDGTFKTVYVGIRGMDVETFKMVYGVDLTAEYGVVIIETVKNSPATEAGLQPNDIIIAIDGKKIENMPDVQRKLYEYKENDKSQFTILRNGQEMNITLTLKIQPAEF
ncbi:MAG: PDZ domain-containing protein [Tissierellia bacterium]|nr:PDZ domain-containing protein [Tissierellia bacterium]